MLLNQDSNTTHTEVEREHIALYIAMHTRFDKHLKHICNEKKKKKEIRKIKEKTFWQGIQLLHLYLFLDFCFNFQRWEEDIS